MAPLRFAKAAPRRDFPNVPISRVDDFAMRSISLTGILMLLFFVRTAVAQAPNLAGVRTVLRQAAERGAIAGAVAHVSQGDRTLLFDSFGNADEGRPMTADAIFRIASMTKPITSVAVMMLVEEGQVRLDDPLSRYVPEFAGIKVMPSNDATGAANPVAPHRAVTVRDVLTHTSGIFYPFNATVPQRKYLQGVRLADGLNAENPTLAENVRQLARVPLAHQPGTAWTYGLNTDVLGRLVEVASGKSLDQFLAERIFQPLGMRDTAFRVPPDRMDRLVAVYTPGEDQRARKLTSDPATFGEVTVSAGRVTGDVRYLSGGAGLVSTAADYARFLRMLLHEGELDGVRVLRPETVRAMTSNQIGNLECAYTIHGDKFGLGFGVTAKPGGAPSVGSYSWGGLYHTFFWIDPSRKLVGLVMTQLYPWGSSTLWSDFQRAVYEGLADNAAAPAQGVPGRAASSGATGATQNPAFPPI
jgi:CubicO group peptidase (beta-lactamase class C family)